MRAPRLEQPSVSFVPLIQELEQAVGGCLWQASQARSCAGRLPQNLNNDYLALPSTPMKNEESNKRLPRELPAA